MSNVKSLGVGLASLALWVADRLDEPSTWAGFGFIWLALGVDMHMSQEIAAIGMAVAGAAAAILKETGAKEPVEPKA